MTLNERMAQRYRGRDVTDRLGFKPYLFCRDEQNRLWEFISYPYRDDVFPMPEGEEFEAIKVRCPNDPCTMVSLRTWMLTPFTPEQNLALRRLIGNEK
jgi:hypothetical protein